MDKLKSLGSNYIIPLLSPLMLMSRIAHADVATSSSVGTFLLNSLEYFQIAAIVILSIILIYHLIKMAQEGEGNGKSKGGIIACVLGIGGVMLLSGIISLLKELTESNIRDLQ